MKLSVAEKKELCEEYAKGCGIKDLKKKFKCSHTTINNIIHKSGITLRNKARVYLNDEEVGRIMELYVGGMSVKDIADKYVVSVIRILSVLKKEGCVLRTNYENRKLKRPVDESVYDTFNEFSEYWAGYLMADGCITQKNGGILIGLSISGSNRNHLKKYLDFIKAPKYKIYENCRNGKITACLAYESYSHGSKLIKWGITPRKNKTAKCMNAKLEKSRHFWRGVFDGDGLIRLRNECNPKLTHIHLTGSKHLINQFRMFTEKDIIKENVELREKKNYFQVDFNGEEAERVLKFLYSDANIYLDRHYEEVKKLIE